MHWPVPDVWLSRDSYGRVYSRHVRVLMPTAWEIIFITNQSSSSRLSHEPPEQRPAGAMPATPIHQSK